MDKHGIARYQLVSCMGSYLLLRDIDRYDCFEDYPWGLVVNDSILNVCPTECELSLPFQKWLWILRQDLSWVNYCYRSFSTVWKERSRSGFEKAGIFEEWRIAEWKCLKPYILLKSSQSLWKLGALEYFRSSEFWSERALFLGFIFNHVNLMLTEVRIADFYVVVFGEVLSFHDWWSKWGEFKTLEKLRFFKSFVFFGGQVVSWVEFWGCLIKDIVFGYSKFFWFVFEFTRFGLWKVNFRFLVTQKHDFRLFSGFVSFDCEKAYWFHFDKGEISFAKNW